MGRTKPVDVAAQISNSASPSTTSKKLLPWLVAVAFLLEQLDTTILNTAVPAIAQALSVPVLSMKAVLASYTLALAVFIPISGWMADRFGTRRVFASAIGMFTLGSLLCGLCSNIHLLVLCRVLQGFGGAMMVPVGRLTLVRAFEKSELIRTMSFVTIPALAGPMLGPLAGGLIIRYLYWRYIFFVNIPIGVAGLILVYLHLPDYREERRRPLDLVGLILFGSGIALLSYVLEVFGDHTLSPAEIVGLLAIAIALIVAYGMHGTHEQFPLLSLKLFLIRTFRVAAAGSFFTRLGIGGVPFLLPLLYQVGLGYSPVESGLFFMPQAVASLTIKLIMGRVLNWVGFRGVLSSNTVIVGSLLIMFATIGLHTPVWEILLLGFCYGGFASLQYTSMNTLVYADISDDLASSASSIASTVQQMAMSFGVAIAALATAVFLPAGARSNSPVFMRGIHEAFIVLGAFTCLSSLIFSRLKSRDGESVSQHKVLHTG
jgi:EmrB/QacA subfamily drug resistance transporter